MTDGWPFAAIALPGAIVVAVSVGMLAMAGAGRHPLWEAHDLNMSEAAALRDAATVLHLVRAGESPTEPRPIRPGLLLPQSVTLSPLEAAIAAERADIVDLLLSVATTVDAAAWGRARCLAARVDDEDIERVLNSHKPVQSPDQNAHCSELPPPWRP